MGRDFSLTAAGSLCYIQAEMPPRAPRRTKPAAKTSSPPLTSAAQARIAEARYKALVEQLPVGVYRTTRDGRFVEANPALARMLGYKKPQDLFAHRATDFYVDAADRESHVAKLTEKATDFREFELHRVDGRKFWARDHCRSIKGPGGSIVYFDGILIDITERKTAERKLQLALRKLQVSNEKYEGLSQSDDLTGLNNRRGFFSFGLQQLKIAKRLKKDSYLVFLDIDNLKEVNDTYGHAVGDLLLQGVATTLRKILRESDVIGRIGGDEFAVLAMRSRGLGERSLVARIEENVRAFRMKDLPRLRLSVSMGLVRINPKNSRQLDDFLAQADFLMYQEKRRKERQGPQP
jgi:diguanylate cyclase (GGDEF)-like protein/PAS domain S-box-containing protein